jgi:DNA mismatch repair protein MutL
MIHHIIIKIYRCYTYIQVDNSFNPFSDDKINKHYSGYKKPEPTANWESLYVGLKQDSEFSRGMLDFSFESEEVTGSLFNDGEVEQTVHSAYQFIKKYIVSSIKSGMVVDQQRAHQRVL